MKQGRVARSIGARIFSIRKQLLVGERSVWLNLREFWNLTLILRASNSSAPVPTL